jgi:signal transduction histidine kinase/CheY-like chemotaxis protein
MPRMVVLHILFVLGLLLPAASSAEPPAAGVQVLHTARLQAAPDAPPRTVALPFVRRVPDGSVLRFAVEFEAPAAPVPGGFALLLPGLRGALEITLNGHRWGAPPPAGGVPVGGAGSIRVVPLPQPLLVAGTNRLELALHAHGRSAALPELHLGAVGDLVVWRERLVLLAFTGPTVVAAAIGCLGLCVLLLQARRPGETLNGYFGVGALVWAFHTLWSAQLDPLLPEPHETVWWNAVFMLFVALMVVFSLRFIGRLGRRGARALLAAAAAGPPLLYAADVFGVLGRAAAGWRLVWIGVVLVTVGVVAQQVARTRSREAALLLGCSAVGAVFGFVDWWRAATVPEMVDVQLTPYAGLMFIALVGWVLIDRFVRASQGLEALNQRLEQRVALKSRELQSALDEMRSAKERAEAADRAKSTFLAAASHDLRQPVHALGLYLAALRGEPMPPAQAEVLQRMAASMSVLDGLFNALLDLSRIDGGGVQAAPRPFAPGPLLARLADAYAPLAAARGLRLSLRLAPAVAQWRAHSDPLLLERVLGNLLSNAIKYTDHGGVLLSARLRHGPLALVWRIEVWDTGIGVAPAEAGRIFDEFYQVDGGGRERGGGFGLGLSIVRRLTRLLGHPLAMHSVPGRGTRFVLELPATAAQAQPEAPPPAPDVLAGACVAVIEDDAGVRHGMALLLGRWGVTVLDAADAETLLRRADPAALARVDAVIADYRLAAGRDGVEAVAALRTRCGRTLPALIVSGDTAPQRVDEIRASGLDWLAKPVPAARLRSWLAAALQRPAAAARARARP